MQNKKNNKIDGYTIIETMISVSLFIVIVTIALGSLLNANLLHKKSQNMRSIIDNLSFVMEDMSSNLRIGYNYYCIIGNDDLSNVSTTKSSPVDLSGQPQGCWGIAFEPTTGNTSNPNDQWVYYISNTGKIFRATTGLYNNPINYVQLTPDEIIIDTAASSFTVVGAEPPSPTTPYDCVSYDCKQPFVTIKLVGSIALPNGVNSPFSLQTSVSQRQIDI